METAIPVQELKPQTVEEFIKYHRSLIHTDETLKACTLCRMIERFEASEKATDELSNHHDITRCAYCQEKLQAWSQLRAS